MKESYTTYEGFPIQKCMLKDSITGLKGLYSALLEPYGHPYADPKVITPKNNTISQLEDALIYVLKTSGTKIYFVDEFQHSCGRNQKSILNQLKRTMLVSRVPLVLVGMPEVEKILKEDEQLFDRCPIKEYSRLEMLSINDTNKARELQSFLKGYEEFLPVPERSNLASPKLAQKIFERVQFPAGHKFHGKTNLRRISDFLAEVTVNALRLNIDCIMEEIIIATTY